MHMMKLPWLRLSFIALLVASAGCAENSSTMLQPALKSGLQKGDDIVPWNPIHVAGPNKGTNACPVCTYLALPAVQIFAKDGPDVPVLASRLEKLVIDQQGRKLKGFLIVLDSTPARLKEMADDLKISRIGICYPDPATREHDLNEYKLNPAASNTVIVYADYKVTANFVNVDAGTFDRVEAAVANLP